MPPKTKRRLQQEKNLESAREVKRRRDSGKGTFSGTATEVQNDKAGANSEG